MGIKDLAETIEALTKSIGPRHARPVILILMLAAAFLGLQPIRELLSHPNFVYLSITILCAHLIIEFFRSSRSRPRKVSLSILVFGFGISGCILNWFYSEAARTPDGGLGVYVATFDGDLDKSTQFHQQIIEEFRSALGHSATVIEIKNSLAYFTDVQIENLAKQLNAAIIVWGTIPNNKIFYPVIWQRGVGIRRLKTRIHIDIEQDLSDFVSYISNLTNSLSVPRQENDDVLQQCITQLNTRSEETGSRGQFSSLLIGITDSALNGDGPMNDVDAMDRAIEQRYKGASVQRLINQEVTDVSVSRSIKQAIANLQDNDTFLLYFSGPTGKDENGKSIFYPLTGQPITLTPVLLKTLEEHPKTVIIIDAGYDTKELPIPSRGAVLVADPTGLGYASERTLDGKRMGALTRVLARIIAAVPEGTSLSAADVFNATRLSLQRTLDPVPGSVLGERVPSF